jgi:hypothetical protein
VCWWDQGEEKFPSNGKEVHHTVHGLNVLDLSIFTLGGMKHASRDELGSPVCDLFLIKLGNELSVYIGLSLLLQVRDDIDDDKPGQIQFGSHGTNVRQLESESIITIFFFFFILGLWLQNFNLDGLLGFLVLKHKLALLTLVVDVLLSNVSLVSELDCFIINCNSAIGAILSLNDNLNMRVSWRNLNTLGVLESNLSGLIIINNGDSGLRVLTIELLVVICVVQLNKEVLIGLPVVVILDSNIKCLTSLALREM